MVNSTPSWLSALRQHIDAAIDHKIAESERDEGGYAQSGMAGERQCAQLWEEVVACFDDRECPRETLYEHVYLRDITEWCLAKPISRNVRKFLSDPSHIYVSWTLKECLVGHKEPYAVKRNELQDFYFEIQALIQKVPRMILKAAAQRNQE